MADYCWKLAKSSAQLEILANGGFAVAMAVLIGPLMEEFVFRKWIIDSMAKRPYFMGILASTFIFTAMHYQ